MPIEFPCGECSTQLRVPDSAAGKQARCPKCGAVWPVPIGNADASSGQDELLREPFRPFEEPAKRGWWEESTAAGGEASKADGKGASAIDSENPYQAPATGSFTVTPHPSSGRTSRFGGRGMVDRVPASRGLRFGGLLLDGVFHTVGMLPAIAMAATLGPRVDEDTEALVTFLALGGVGIVAVANWILISMQGQSFAKWILGMQIINVNTGRPASFVDGVLLRIWVIGFINQLCGLFSLLDAIWIFNNDMRCIHDHIASTHVIMKDASTTYSRLYERP